MVSGRSRVRSGRKPPAEAHSPNTLLGAWESMLMSSGPFPVSFSTATRSKRVLRAGLVLSSRYTSAPGTSSSRQRPVFFTWHTSVRPSTSTWAINRLGRARKRPGQILSYRTCFLPPRSAMIEIAPLFDNLLRSFQRPAEYSAFEYNPPRGANQASWRKKPI